MGTHISSGLYLVRKVARVMIKLGKEIMYSCAIIAFGFAVYSSIKSESYYVAGLYTLLILVVLSDSREKEQ